MESTNPTNVNLQMQLNPSEVQQKAGFQLVRIFSYPGYLNTINYYSQANFTWLITIEQQGLVAEKGSNWTISDWDSYVTEVVSQNPNAHYFEILNEVDRTLQCPNSGAECTGYLNSLGNPALAYYNMLKDAYQIIEAQNPSAVLIAFGGLSAFDPTRLAQYDSGNFTGTNVYQFAEQVWSYGASKYCDAISVHFYPKGGYALDQPPGGPGNPALSQIVTGVVNSYESLTGKPIYFTETGDPMNNPACAAGDNCYNANINSLASQAQFLSQDFQLLSSFSFTKAILWWNLIGLSSGYDMGLYDPTTLQSRPALQAFASIAA
jgi:hypothetical protein